MSLLIVEVGQVHKAKDDRQFFVASFRAGLGQKRVNRTFWQQFKNDAEGNKTKEVYWDRMSPEEAIEALKAKAPIEGKRVTQTVLEYEVAGRPVNTYSTVIFPDENLNALFASQNKVIVDPETGEQMYELRKRVSLAPAESAEKVGEAALANA